MSRQKSRSRKQSKKRKQARRSSGTRSNGQHSKRLRRLSSSQESERVRVLDAANLYRHGKAKTVSDAARMAGTNLNAMWRWVPLAIEKDPRTGRLRIKASDRYSERVEIVTYDGALVVRARGSRQRQIAGQHRATYMGVFEKKKPASALEEFRGKKVGGHELLSDYSRLLTLAKAGALGNLDTLYVSAGGR